ncbi:MAG: 30S ribosomal protein S5 [Alphaproteobacteria bacterium]|nr:30S ribosomal protein S5 [Alphaproteobacteria bacterium]
MLATEKTTARRKKREPRDKIELIEKLVHVNRVAKVVKGGRRFAFAALVVVGDGKGKIGFGSAKAREVPDAVVKATAAAKNNMVHIPMKEGRTLHHDIVAKFGAGKVIIKRAKPGTGVIAGGAMRSVFEAMGIQDVVAKSIGSTNPHNLIRATLAGLQSISSPKFVANKRNKKVSEVLNKKSNEDEAVESVSETV